MSLDPPLVGFLPGKSSSSWPMIAETGRLCVNALGADQQPICRALARSGSDKFADMSYTSSDHGQPVIAGSPTSIECTIESVTEAGDHWFMLGRILTMGIYEKTGHGPLLERPNRFSSELADVAEVSPPSVEP